MFSGWNVSPRWLPWVNVVPLENFPVSKMEHMLAWVYAGPGKLALLLWIIYNDV